MPLSYPEAFLNYWYSCTEAATGDVLRQKAFCKIRGKKLF